MRFVKNLLACADAQTDLSLRLSLKFYCRFCHALTRNWIDRKPVPQCVAMPLRKHAHSNILRILPPLPNSAPRPPTSPTHTQKNNNKKQKNLFYEKNLVVFKFLLKT